jgi:hypothetical protein
VLQLQVHQRHRLLHVHDVRRCEVGMPFAQPQIDAQRSNVLPGPEARTQQTASVEPLKPLCIVHVTLASRDASSITRVGDDDIDAMTLEYFVNRHPVHTGGLHGNRRDAYRRQPFRHTLQVAGERLERLNWVVT